MQMFDLIHRHETMKHDMVLSSYQEGGDERDPLGYYFCRCGCALVFSTKTTRNRYVFWIVIAK